MTRLDNDYFERIYRDHPDPWGFATRWYEARKYLLTLATLPRERYARAFEPGCSIGVLSEGLAERCDELIACDLAASALQQARVRLACHSHVKVEHMAVPDQWPAGMFELIVLSEVAYYFDEGGLHDLLQHVEDSTRIGAHLSCTHYCGVTDYPLSGDRVHELIANRRAWRRLSSYVEDAFLLDVYERVGA